jgi:ubiquinone/menaquinone biosynthesis C-methylase UbiE
MSTQKKKPEDSLLIKMIEDDVSTDLLHFFENLVLEKFVSLEKSMTLQLGCGTKDFNGQLLEKMGQWSRQIIIEPSNVLLDSIRLELGSKAEGKVFFKSDLDWNRLPFDNDVFQTAMSVLFWDKSPNRFRTLSELCRVLAPSGMALLTAFLRDSAREFFDLYSEILTQFDLAQLTQPLQKVRTMFLTKDDYQMLAEECGFSVTKVSQHTTTITFASSRDLFASPLVRTTWLPVWEKIGGKESERIFWHIRQSMDRYYSGRTIPLTIYCGLIVAIK